MPYFQVSQSFHQQAQATHRSYEQSSAERRHDRHGLPLSHLSLSRWQRLQTRTARRRGGSRTTSPMTFPSL